MNSNVAYGKLVCSCDAALVDPANGTLMAGWAGPAAVAGCGPASGTPGPIAGTVYPKNPGLLSATSTHWRGMQDVRIADELTVSRMV